LANILGRTDPGGLNPFSRSVDRLKTFSLLLCLTNSRSLKKRSSMTPGFGIYFESMNLFPQLARLFLLAAAFLVAMRTLLALAAPPPEAQGSLEVTATNGAGIERHFTSENGFAGRIRVKLNQAVPVTLQFPIEKAGLQVAVGCLDGGEILGNHSVILPTGKVLFVFRGGEPGLYRVLVDVSGEQNLIEFYVIDPNRPLPTPRPSH
jgi:hypothetical protein